MVPFFTYFTSGFGTLVLAVLLLALVTGAQVQVGAFGLGTCLALAFFYAVARKGAAASRGVTAKKLSEVCEHPLYEEFLSEDPERRYIYKEELPGRFAEWLDARSVHTPADKPG